MVFAKAEVTTFIDNAYLGFKIFNIAYCNQLNYV